jgi:Phytanoyl-CoA dioxygenase (PhyH)
VTTKPLAQLPALDSEYPLTDDQVTAFQRDGFILLRGVATPDEIAAYQPIIRDAALSNSAETRKLEERDTYGKAFLQVINLWTKDEAVARFVKGRRFASIAARLMGVRGVRLYHDQALFKEGGGGYTPLHTDLQFWPLDTDNAVTM